MKIKLLFAVCIIVVTVSACQSAPSATPADTAQPAASIIVTIPPEMNDERITAYTPTITPTATPSLTPLPTLASADQVAFIRSLFMETSCELPCVAGITPGETAFGEADQWLAQAALYTGYDGSNPNYAAHRYIYDPYALPFMFGENPEFTLYTLGDIAQIQYLEADLVNISLQELFATYGTPDRIKIEVAYEMDRYYSLAYRVFFIYQDLHSAFSIHFPIDIIINAPDIGPASICPLQAQNGTPVLHLVTWGEDFVSFAYMNDLLPAQLTA
ncbi:MAG TPA: hypothetical protein VN376_03390, partial [Longilinea sp.]|nr:hypothetical protein [Longilinea sp.]